MDDNSGPKSRAWIRRNWKCLLFIIVLFLIVDGAKSYAVAKWHMRKHTNVRCSGMLFFGVWFVNFKHDGAHKDCVATYVIPPVLPIVLEELHCK
jgi:hypothetical protein